MGGPECVGRDEQIHILSFISGINFVLLIIRCNVIHQHANRENKTVVSNTGCWKRIVNLRRL